MLVYPIQAADVKDELGSKGNSLIQMLNLGIPVPNAFIISSKVCADINLIEQIDLITSVSSLSDVKKFGDVKNPLLVSVRSGALVSMPGMMNTILNVGINDEIYKSLAGLYSINFANQIYSKFLIDYAVLVLGCDQEIFAHVDCYDISSIKLILDQNNIFIPQDVFEQLKASIIMVIKSWNNESAKGYRQAYDVSDDLGTAVIIQSMVFGNLDSDSSTGVLFSRNPSTGKKKIFGEFLSCAQGDDIVSGRRNPESLLEISDELKEILVKLENLFKSIVEIEFTIEKGKLWILQSRKAKISPIAAVKVAVDMVEEGAVSKEDSLSLVSADDLMKSFNASIDKQKYQLITNGLGCSPGIVSGSICLDIKDLNKYDNPILVVNNVNPDDFDKIRNCTVGVISKFGGSTSHMAVVIRAMGKPYISSLNEMQVCSDRVVFNNTTLMSGDVISIDGNSGDIFLGQVEINNDGNENSKQLAQWSGEYLDSVKICLNADFDYEIAEGRKLGVSGIGLCRTEHICLKSDYLLILQKLILSFLNGNIDSNLLDAFRDFQKEEFIKIFKACSTLNGEKFPINIRLLDPPLHEFLPESAAFSEKNPMLGCRGCRLGVVFPDIYKSQISAIFSALKQVEKEGFYGADIGIMLPLISNVKEIEYFSEMIARINKDNLPFRFGSMIETPAACIKIKEIVKDLDFISFGSNDLTQMTLGISRDDSEFLNSYYEKDILNFNPFQRLDIDSVGELIKVAVSQAKEVNNNLDISICGEHAADQFSIGFLISNNCNIISCSLHRVLLSKFAAYKFLKKLFDK